MLAVKQRLKCLSVMKNVLRHLIFQNVFRYHPDVIIVPRSEDEQVSVNVDFADP